MGDEQISEGIRDSKKEESEVSITYETLFELLRREKNRDELQELQHSFFHDVVSYLRAKNNIVQNQSNGLFATDEKEKTLIQLQNIKKILRELYDRREKKIINMAINKARTKSNIIDSSKLLDEEKSLFNSLNKTLETFRDGVLLKVSDAQMPLVEAPTEPYEPPEDTEKKQQYLNTTPSESEKEANKTISVRFLDSIDQFVGPELELYGPYEEEETAELPLGVGDLLIRKGKAVEDKN